MTKRFGGLVAVNDVGVRTQGRARSSAHRPSNGAGKSTMFISRHRSLTPNSGRVTLAGTDITGWPQRKIANAGVSRTFQHVKLRPSMTLPDNVALGAYVRTRSGYLAGALRLDSRRGAAGAVGGPAATQARRPRGHSPMNSPAISLSAASARWRSPVRSQRIHPLSCSTRAGRRPAPAGEAGSRGPAPVAARRRRDDPSRRA